ncbi:MAG: restriction endonuclease [Solirubrobacteraceae bacterium]|nr:restriction endonuclease [Solirubrobacteraceae bacterium]
MLQRSSDRDCLDGTTFESPTIEVHPGRLEAHRAASLRPIRPLVLISRRSAAQPPPRSIVRVAAYPAKVASTKRVSANAIVALKDALVAAFWFKRDLYNWAKAAVHGEPTFLSGIDWLDPDQYKRDSVSLFVDRLVKEQDLFPGLLLRVLVDVAAMDAFPQLKRAENADVKIAEAQSAVARLRALVAPYEEQLKQEQATRERIDVTKHVASQRRATSARLLEIKGKYIGLGAVAPQKRGYELEAVLRDTFDAFDLDPRASFRVTGEQIDGGFSLGGEHFILEAKWHQAPTSRDDLDILDRKVHRRSDNTLGLFVAINGFQPTAIELHSRQHSPLILMDGQDLYAVLDERIDLPELLRAKRREASMTGSIFHPASKILVGT